MLPSWVGAWNPPKEQPPLLKADAVRLIEQGIRSHALVWDKLSFPLQIPRNEQGQRLQWLDNLSSDGVVSRTGKMQKSRSKDGGILFEAVWDYQLSEQADWRQYPDGKRLVYGYPELQQLVSLSPAYWVDDAWYAEAVVEWHVAGLAHWAKLPVFKRERLFRRSIESYQKPFTRSVYLQFTEAGWQFWEQPDS